MAITADRRGSPGRAVAASSAVRRFDAPELGEAGQGWLWSGARWERRWLAIFLCLGVLARLLRYLLCFPLWEDECFLAVNLAQRGFAELRQPLDYHQVCPVTFLWIEKLVVRLAGFHEYALRLVPLLASLGAVVLFVFVAGRLLDGLPRLLAIGIFSVSYPMIRYGAEAKPYGLDLLVSLVVLALWVWWHERPRATGRLWLLVATAPAAVALSFPAVFLAGGVSVAVGWAVWGQRDRRGVLAWVAYNLVVAVSFVWLLHGATARQSAAELEFMRGCWQDAFPPLAAPWKLPRWLWRSHVSDLVAFPLGGPRGASMLTSAACAAGMAAWWHGRRVVLLLLGVVPLALQFAAAALERYPYGGHVKFSMYLAPWICLTAGCGAAVLIEAWQRRCAGHRGALAVVLAGLALVATGTMARDLWKPAKTWSDIRARDFARWFWLNAEYDAEVACLKTDFERSFAPAADRELNWSATFLCNQFVYSPRHRRGERFAWERVSALRPLRVVEYRAMGFDYDHLAAERWLAEMQQRFDLVGRETFPFVRLRRDERSLAVVDRLEVYKFVPKGSVARGAGIRQAARR